MWFEVEAVPLSFTESSPYVIENIVEIDASASRVFEIISCGEGLSEWFQDFRDVRWTSPEPHGVGSEREFELSFLTVKEHFLAWDPGKRIAFRVYGMTLPIVSAMLEDMIIDATSESTSRLTWRVHYRPSLIMRLVHPIARSIFGKMFRQSAESLARWAKAHPGR